MPELKECVEDSIVSYTHYFTVKPKPVWKPKVVMYPTVYRGSRFIR